MEPLTASLEEREEQAVNIHYDVRPPELTRWQQRQVPLIGWAGYHGVQLIGRTLRFEVLGYRHVQQEHAGGRRCILTFWHRCIFAATWWWRDRGIVVLNSTNFDGQWTRRVIERLGFGTAQGSSTRGGLRGLAAMAGSLEQGRDVAFTIDGPRGPRYVAKPGPVMLARRTRQAIVPFHIGLADAWTLEDTWDLFQIPQPFSRAVVVIGAPIRVAADATRDEMQRKHEKMQAALERVRDVAESWFALPPEERARLRAAWDM